MAALHTKAKKEAAPPKPKGPSVKAQARKHKVKKTATSRALAKKVRKIAKLEGKSLEPKPPKSAYSLIIADLICGRLANGESLALICRTEGYPSASTVMDWVHHPNEDTRPGFLQRYLDAREIGYHLMADQIIDISDDSSKDKIKKIVNGKIIEVIDHENINRDRLRVDSRKFILAKALPKIYGDKLAIEHTGSIDLVGRLEAARARLKKEETIAEQAEGPGLIEGVLPDGA